MWVQTGPKNEHDPHRCQSPKILSDIVSQYLNIPPSEHHPHDHQKLHVYTWQATPNGISIPLHYDSYVCIRSHPHFTPQAAGNTTLRDLRKGNNQDLSLLECLEFCDKRDILAKTKEFRDKFSVSRKSFDSFVKGMEKIRNELAHSQNSIISNIEWAEFINIVSNDETFLINSDNEVEAMALQGNDFEEMLIPSV
jgi:hypothetical protein